MQCLPCRGLLKSTAVGVTKVFSEKVSTRVAQRPELDKAVEWARELRTSGLDVTLVVHEHKRLGRGLQLAELSEQLRGYGVALKFITGELQGSHDPGGIVFTVWTAILWEAVPDQVWEPPSTRISTPVR